MTKIDMTDYNIISRLFEEHKHLILIGAGGTGKSTNINLIIEEYEKNGLIVEKTAPTGIASHNIDGITINSLLRFADTNSMEEYYVYIEHKVNTEPSFNLDKLEFELKEKISKLNLLIIDEVSMVSADKWELIDHLLEKYGFTGKILLSGDIFQLAPISAPSKYIEENPNTDARFFFDSPVWKDYKFVPYILENVRRTDDKEFIEILHRIRTGDITKSDIDYLSKMRENEHISNQNPTILSSRNDFVFNYNKDRLQEIREEMCVIEKEVEIVLNSRKRDLISGDLKETIENYISKNLLMEKKLFLKKGALVVFLANSPEKINNKPVYTNGEKGIVTEIEDDFIVIRKIGETEDLILPKYNYGYFDWIGNEFTLVANILQFPIKLGWAMTIHKSQSLSIDNIILDISHIFTNGQFYVGISRAINPKNVYIKYNKNKFMFEYDLKKFVRPNQSAKQFYIRAKQISQKYINS